MNSWLSYFLLVSLSLFQVSRASYNYSITTPVDGTLWTVKSQVQVNWLFTVDHSTPSPTSIQVVLMKGAADNADNVAVLANNVGPSAGSVTFTCPNLPNGTDYFIKLGNPDLADFKYSHYFAITGYVQNTTQTTTASPSGKVANEASYLTHLSPAFLFMLMIALVFTWNF